MVKGEKSDATPIQPHDYGASSYASRQVPLSPCLWNIWPSPRCMGPLNRQAARGRLSARSEKGGGLGIVELRDDPPLAASKIVHLAELIRNAKRCVVLTGAGISTSAGVSDFRGPNGVWTSESKGVAPPASKSFDTVHPTFTHMALAALVEAGRVELVVSQNVDGLHLRSGLPRARCPPPHAVHPDPPGGSRTSFP
jgi:hypothetical protein